MVPTSNSSRRVFACKVLASWTNTHDSPAMRAMQIIHIRVKVFWPCDSIYSAVQTQVNTPSSQIENICSSPLHLRFWT